MEIIKIDGNLASPKLYSNSYICVSGGNAIVIDPSFELGGINRILFERYGCNKNIVATILTHCHADHCRSLVDYQKSTVYLTERTKFNLADPNITLEYGITGEKIDFSSLSNYKIIKDGDVVKFCDDIVFKIKFTPGHTSDSICIYDDTDIFVGDLIFSGGGVGRADLPTGSLDDLKVSIDWLNGLDSKICVHSGHGEDFILSKWRS